MRTYEIRKGTMTGTLIATVEADTYEQAAGKAADTAAVKRAFGIGKNAGLGTNRETGVPGRSGVFSLRRREGAHAGAIHVASANGAPDAGR